MPPNIAQEILEALEDARAYVDGRDEGLRITTVMVGDVRAIRKSRGMRRPLSERCPKTPG